MKRRRERASFARFRNRGQIASCSPRAFVGQSARGHPRCQGTSIRGGRGIDNGKLRVIFETDILEVPNIREHTIRVVDLRGMEGGGLGRFRSRQLGRGVGARIDGCHDLM